MADLLWDASALVKRYTPEAGSDTVDAIFAAISSLWMVTTSLGYAETCATIRRKYNRALMNFATFALARSLLLNEVLLSPLFRLLTLDDQAVLAGVALTDHHNLNTSDASTLAAYLDYARALPSTAPGRVLVASDRRLLRAAQAEGLPTINPETLPAADVPAALAAY